MKPKETRKLTRDAKKIQTDLIKLNLEIQPEFFHVVS